mgnify:CR=1 FL=1
MIVVTLTDCPPRLRGDLSKWLLEINTGVYVGQTSQRVREALWKRICDNLPKGRATMVYSANNEQKMEFRVHNTTWQPVDYEGLTLMRRPLTSAVVEDVRATPGKAAVDRMAQQKTAAQVRKKEKEGYVVIDIETTGLDCEKDEILEVGAIRIRNHEVAEKFVELIRPKGEISKEISALNGITQEMALKEGKERAEVLKRFWEFVGESPMVGHNLSFDRAFLEKGSAKVGIAVPRVACRDTLLLARRRIRDVPDYRLNTLANYFGIQISERHRALADCLVTFYVYEKLNEL